MQRKYLPILYHHVISFHTFHMWCQKLRCKPNRGARYEYWTVWSNIYSHLSSPGHLLQYQNFGNTMLDRSRLISSTTLLLRCSFLIHTLSHSILHRLLRCKKNLLGTLDVKSNRQWILYLSGWSSSVLFSKSAQSFDLLSYSIRILFAFTESLSLIISANFNSCEHIGRVDASAQQLIHWTRSVYPRSIRDGFSSSKTVTELPS